MKKKSQPPQQNSNFLENFITTMEISQPYPRNRNPSRKNLNPSQKLSTPTEKNSTPPEISQPLPKISQPPLKISQPHLYFLFLPLLLHFPKIKSEKFGGGVVYRPTTAEFFITSSHAETVGYSATLVNDSTPSPPPQKLPCIDITY